MTSVLLKPTHFFIIALVSNWTFRIGLESVKNDIGVLGLQRRLVWVCLFFGETGWTIKLAEERGLVVDYWGRTLLFVLIHVRRLSLLPDKILLGEGIKQRLAIQTCWFWRWVGVLVIWELLYDFITGHFFKLGTERRHQVGSLAGNLLSEFVITLFDDEG